MVHEILPQLPLHRPISIQQPIQTSPAELIVPSVCRLSSITLLERWCKTDKAHACREAAAAGHLQKAVSGSAVEWGPDTNEDVIVRPFMGKVDVNFAEVDVRDGQ